MTCWFVLITLETILVKSDFWNELRLSFIASSLHRKRTVFFLNNHLTLTTRHLVNIWWQILWKNSSLIILLKLLLILRPWLLQRNWCWRLRIVIRLPLIKFLLRTVQSIRLYYIDIRLGVCINTAAGSLPLIHYLLHQAEILPKILDRSDARVQFDFVLWALEGSSVRNEIRHGVHHVPETLIIFFEKIELVRFKH